MKTEDFDRLKAVCEKEGFEIGFKYDESTYTVRLKKDIWEGVEFVKSVWSSKIYPISQVDIKLRTDVKKDDWIPSTESAYIEQLKAEAFKRFGEIKDGDRFELESTSYNGKIDSYCKEWNYSKFGDYMVHRGVRIYQKGQWATRVKERVKVEWFSTSCDTIRFDYCNSKDVNLVKDGPKLAKLIEKYLNKE